MVRFRLKSVLMAILTALPETYGFVVDPNDPNSLRSGAAIAANNLIALYDGYRSGGTIGMFQAPTYWWEAGAAWNGYLDFNRLTGNTTYNEVAKVALLFQTGENFDYLPVNFSNSAGNDDQAFWALGAMSAAEYNFSNPTAKQPQWLGLAQAVFNQQAIRWDTANCGGGLRWQIYQFNNGYNYKNSVSNGAFFNLAARLARYTGNATYALWADKVYDWSLQAGFINSSTFAVYDGASAPTCAIINQIQWTYNNGLYMAGSAFMYNYTNGDAKWGIRTQGFITRAATDFFLNGIIYEPACEPYDSCNVDQHSFKGYLARFMAYTIQMYPQSTNVILPLLKSSAAAAAKACTGPPSGVNCGFKWTWNNGTFDGSLSVGNLVGQNLAALETIQSSLITSAPAPFTNATGGSSTGDPSAGTGNKFGSSTTSGALKIRPATLADKAGAGFITALMTLSTFGFAAWMII